MRRLPPLNSIRAFEATARHLSFSKASEELNVTPGAVSQQVKVLEDYLNLKLFKRKNRMILLTDEAQISLPLLTESLDNMSQAIDMICEQSNDKPLTVTVSPTFASRWLMPRLSSFRNEYPDIDVRIDATNDIVDLVNDDIDVGIRFGTGEYSRLEAEFLFSQNVIPVCSPKLLDGKVKLEMPEDLENHTLLHAHGDYFFIESVQVDWEMWFATMGIENINARHGLHFSQHNLLIEAAIRGQGVALVGDVVINDELKSGQLVKLFEDTDIPLNLSYYLIYSKNRSNQPRIQAFRQWLLDEVKKVMWA